MKIKLFLVPFIFLAFSHHVFSQNEAEEAVKKVIHFETESYIKRDSMAWKDQFIQNEKTSRAYSSLIYSDSQVGWENFAPMMLQWMKDAPSPSRYTDIQHNNHVINISDDLAFVAFDQLLSVPAVDSIPPSVSREFRTLIREDDKWKISSIVSIYQNDITTDPQMMEDFFNFLGYTYLEDDMIDKALEVFKLNVKLYPNAWNAYDSLGEAYTLAGNKDLAIENYQKSIELNPENDNGKEMLTKLEKD